MCIFFEYVDRLGGVSGEVLEIGEFRSPTDKLGGNKDCFALKRFGNIHYEHN